MEGGGRRKADESKDLLKRKPGRDEKRKHSSMRASKQKKASWNNHEA